MKAQIQNCVDWAFAIALWFYFSNRVSDRIVLLDTILEKLDENSGPFDFFPKKNKY